jgi:ABC-type multidrug transport system ATPase subunit
MTVGLITPNEGRIFLDDLDITKYPVYKRAQTGIGYLAQEASVFRQMSVEDNIAAVLEMTDKPLDYQKDKLESLIAEFRLQKVRKNKGNQLSGGERRRTEIARCLAIDPKFIMLDEPFAGVDPIAVEDIQQIVWKLKDRNIGILITDHNVQETLSIVRHKMNQLGTRNFGAYARKMLIDGYIIKVDYTEQKKLAAAVSRIATNINHVCRRINSTGHFYDADVAELKERMADVWELLKVQQRNEL